MLRRYSSDSGPSASASDHLGINWDICALCQEQKHEKLICPAKNTREGCISGYRTLATNFQRFKECDCMPDGMNLERLDDGEGLATTFEKHAAVWHKSCYSKYNTLKLERALKRKSGEWPEESSPVKTRSERAIKETVTESIESSKCFFCEGTNGPFHRSATSDIDKNVRLWATELRDTKLFAKLVPGDMHAINAFYHKKCMTSLYNRFKQARSRKTEENNQSTLEGLALAQLVSYIEDVKTEEDGTPIFKLSDLVKMYRSRLHQLGASVPSRINSTRLKERLLHQLVDLRAYTEGREVMLVFAEDIAHALQFTQENTDLDALHLSKAAQIVRTEFLQKKQTFDGSFSPNCHEESVPTSLLALVNMILDGPNIGHQTTHQDKGVSQAAVTISELLMFNAVKHSRSGTTTIRHNVERETPLPIYLSMVIHAETRKKGLIDKFHRLGLGISYDRVMHISADMGNTVCDLYEKQNVVCPPKLKTGLLTTASVDNIDHNPSSRTAKDSFHGTAISLTQHPSQNALGTARNIAPINHDIQKQKSMYELPIAYTTIQPVTIPSGDQFVPTSNSSTTAASDLVTNAMESEHQWLDRAQQLVNKDELTPGDHVSWSAYHASLQPPLTRPLALTSLLPLFQECAHSHAMILHSMKIVMDATNFLNPGQTPVLAMDQPLFAIGKQVQWNKLDLVGEHKIVLMMGGLHIEMAMLRCLGHWLDNSGWTNVLVKAEITTSGRADANLKGSHVTRTRYMHQVTAAALYILQRKEYCRFLEQQTESEDDFETWVNKQSEKHPQFKFWATTLDLQLMVMCFIRSLREGNFSLYVQVLGQLVPWLFAMDQHNYARWTPVHIRDMLTLPDEHPDIYRAFQDGKFAVQKSSHVFSLIALDHRKENCL